MQTRINPAKASPEAYKAMLAVQNHVNQSGLESTIQELVKLRASQINGCAFCLAMHTRDARKLGISDERMHLLNAWRETPLYSEREQAALAWTEALTLITEGHAPDEVYARVRAQFSDKELVELTLAITTINAWNRLAIGFRTPPEVSSGSAR